MTRRARSWRLPLAATGASWPPSPTSSSRIAALPRTLRPPGLPTSCAPTRRAALGSAGRRGPAPRARGPRPNPRDRRARRGNAADPDPPLPGAARHRRRPPARRHPARRTGGGAWDAGRARSARAGCGRGHRRQSGAAASGARVGVGRPRVCRHSRPGGSRVRPAAAGRSPRLLAIRLARRRRPRDFRGGRGAARRGAAAGRQRRQGRAARRRPLPSPWASLRADRRAPAHGLATGRYRSTIDSPWPTATFSPPPRPSPFAAG